MPQPLPPDPPTYPRVRSGLPDPAARPLLPLAGLTLLAVEDSRFASDALRLLCQRSGARLRRAEDLHAARAHLSVYRPDAVIVDLGLPDGRGDALIAELAAQGTGRPLVLGSSGDTAGRAIALDAGADGFLEKPLHSLAAFQQAVLGLPPCPTGFLADTGSDPLPAPDPLALRDDLAQARHLAHRLLQNDAPDSRRPYLAAFVAGLARSTRDAALEQAATAIRHTPAALPALEHLLAQRSSHAGFVFTQPV